MTHIPITAASNLTDAIADFHAAKVEANRYETEVCGVASAEWSEAVAAIPHYTTTASYGYLPHEIKDGVDPEKRFHLTTACETSCRIARDHKPSDLAMLSDWKACVAELAEALAVRDAQIASLRNLAGVEDKLARANELGTIMCRKLAVVEAFPIRTAAEAVTKYRLMVEEGSEPALETILADFERIAGEG